MATCGMCSNSGFFLKLYNGLCIDCARLVQNKLEVANQTIQDESENFAAYSEGIESYAVENVVHSATRIVESAKYLSECANNGYATNTDEFISQWSDVLDSISNLVNRAYLQAIDEETDEEARRSLANQATVFFSSVIGDRKYSDHFQGLLNK